MYTANPNRYNEMTYHRCGKSGVLLPRVSLGLWHNFGYESNYENMVSMVTCAFDLGITHFDIANNYGPPPGSAEENFGRILRGELRQYRDQLFISSKAGYHMWEGPYGDFGSRKYMMASIDQSLKRCGLEYFDLFYSHRPDPNTPIEETMGALADMVKQGKALYVGISNYDASQTEIAVDTLQKLGVKCLIHQHCYNMLQRSSEDGLLQVLREKGVGSIAYSPLAQGQLTNRYLDGIPADSRAGKNSVFLKKDDITPQKISLLKQLKQIADNRRILLSQLALLWILRRPEMTSVLVGASKPSQNIETAKVAQMPPLTDEEISKIETLLTK